jgi:drug/metabolite transporter (DMT)-like permease
LGVSLGQEVVTGYEWGAAGVVLLGVVLLLRAKR